MSARIFFVKHHIIFYGIICILANLLAVISASVLASFTPETIASNQWTSLKEWIDFLCKHEMLTNFAGIISYLIPILMCTQYGLKARGLPHNDERYIEIMVHIPTEFALRGIAGWICNFLVELCFLAYLKITVGLKVGIIIISSAISHICLSIIAFTLIFFTLETLNRTLVLPSIYPDGGISSTSRTHISSIKSLFLFHFFSAAVFPSLFLGIRLFMSMYYGIDPNGYSDFVFVGLALLAGFAMSCLMTRFFQAPLKKLTESANKISEGDYECKTIICSNDEMGVLGDAFNAMTVSLKEKEFMRDTFGKIVTPQVRDYLLKGNVTLGGETVDATVMFCDIRSFTTLSESMKPRDVVALLNEYFTGLEKCITAHGGVINKYIGDAIMALFGIPVHTQTHAHDAFEAAQDMRQELLKMNESFASRGMPQLHFGIALHSGSVLAGNIGAASRMEYTVIGDTVNAASRIEGLCKQYGKDLLISQATVDLLNINQNSKKIVFVDEAELRGKKEKIRLYTDLANI